MTNNITDLKKELKEILTDNVSLAIQKLEAVLVPDDEETEKELFLHNSALSRLEKNNRHGKISDELYNIELNKLTSKVFDFIQELSEENFQKNYHIKEEIRENILVVCSPERKEEMMKLFPLSYFPSTKFHNWDNANLPDLEKIKVIVYDDIERPKSFDRNNPDLEKTLTAAKNTNTYLLYFGAVQPYDEFSDIAYFSNSKFSLHARLKELLDYIKYHKTT